MNTVDFSRRDFLQKLTAAGGLTLTAMLPLSFTACASNRQGSVAGVPYAWSHFSVSHLPEMKADIDKMKAQGLISTQETFRSYIDRRDFTVPKEMPEAKSIIMVATFTPLMLASFEYNGMAHEVFLPPGYYKCPPEEEELFSELRKNVIGSPDAKLAYASTILQKTAAARCGLTRYGRNNIAYAPGMGSYLTLWSYFCDVELEDHWQPAAMLKSCRDCDICIQECPNSCISKDKFVIDAGRCTTLYNEIEGEFPDFIPADAHNSLMGCMHCQFSCPENQKVFEKSETLALVPEEDTQAILSGQVDEAKCKAIGDRLKGFGGSKDYYPAFSRNLQVLL